MRLHIEITRRPGIADPEAVTVSRALRELGFDTVVDVGMGRSLIIDVDETDPDAARQAADRMCRQLLANPVLEDYSIEVLAEEVAG
jgi:phosphoribosylformylglycinamidine synthase PurS subunit